MPHGAFCGPMFIMTAFHVEECFRRAKYRNLADFQLGCEVLPLLLIGLSYLLVIRGSLLPVNDEFIHPLISIDGYYIKIPGPCFFLLLVLYTRSNLLLWYGRKEFAQFMLAG